MALDENIIFVRSQLDLYRATLASSYNRLQDVRKQYESLQEELRARRSEIRGLREALVQPDSTPSRAVIEEIIRTQASIEHYQSVQDAADSLTDELRETAREWATLSERLKRLSGDDLTDDDIAKLNEFQASVRQQLGLYEFRSFQPGEINLSRDNFRPLVLTRVGTDDDSRIIEKEINFEVSASDAVRLKWAYYLALLAVSVDRATNHCGLLVFDEPGQQEIEVSSLHAMLRWSASHVTTHQQVLIATSEPLASITTALTGTTANVISFAGFILQPLA